MDPSEIEFLAETESVRIVPNFNEGQLYLLTGDVGPFRAGLPIEVQSTTVQGTHSQCNLILFIFLCFSCFFFVQVPLWVGVNLRQRQKCRFLAPTWMSKEILEEVRDSEKSNPFFGPLPNGHMFVVAQLILDVGISDISHADLIKTILKDIWDIRQAKLRSVLIFLFN